MLVLLGLPLGVLLDRARSRRTVMMAMALLCAAAAVSVSAADGLGGVGGPHVVAVLMATTALGALAPIGVETCLPAVAGRERLVPANVLLYLMPAVLFLALAPLSSLLDSDDGSLLIFAGALLLCAALGFRLVRADEEPPPPRSGFWREAAEGVRCTAREPALRAIALYLVMSELFAEVTVETATKAREVASLTGGLSVGEIMTYPAYASFLLAPLLAMLLHRRLGAFRLAWVSVLVTEPFALLLALTGTEWGHLWYLAGTIVPRTGAIIVFIALTSHRQAITPDRLLGRVSGLLLAVATLAGAAGDLLEGPAEWLAGSRPGPLTLLPGLAVSTALSLAAAIPLVRAHRRNGRISEYVISGDNT
ncbi:MFS transporter [Nonomuraea insulae]|uniref:MFS transporter n=1 Tax=Nonomuraea insulae TaxID=1616787 RepID=A0ABW1CJP5_9ACTN